MSMYFCAGGSFGQKKTSRTGGVIYNKAAAHDVHSVIHGSYCWVGSIIPLSSFLLIFTDLTVHGTFLRMLITGKK